jgi:hypothetical protein
MGWEGTERCASGAAGSGSVADAVRRRLHALVRLGLLRRVASGLPRSCRRGGHRLLAGSAFVAEDVFDLPL